MIKNGFRTTEREDSTGAGICVKYLLFDVLPAMITVWKMLRRSYRKIY